MAEVRAGPILVTGTSGEIGSALAAHFVARGEVVLGLDKQGPRSDAPTRLQFRRCDLADGAQVSAVIDELVRAHGVPRVVVNCAGRIANSPLVSLGADGWQVHDFELWDDIVRSSLYSAFYVSAVVAKHLLAGRKRGVIINFSSISARGNPGQAAYSAAKAGLNGLTMALAKELGPVGIRVVAIAPGYFDTRSTSANVPAAKLTKLTGAVPLKRLGALSELIDAIDFIIANDYLNATILELDGGLVL